MRHICKKIILGLADVHDFICLDPDADQLFDRMDDGADHESEQSKGHEQSGKDAVMGKEINPYLYNGCSRQDSKACCHEPV